MLVRGQIYGSIMKTSYKKYFDLQGIVNNIKLYLPSFDEKKFLQAFEFADKAHEGQLRKDNKTPYIVHPVQVVEILIGLHADEETLISALMHDVPEDTEYTIDYVKKLFGERIAFLVDGVTKLSKVQYRDNMPERQIESLKKLFLHSSQDLRGILIKLADRLHNMKTLKNIKREDKRLRIARETLEVYVPIANLLGLQEMKNQLEDLCFHYLFPTEYQQILAKRKKGEKIRSIASSSFISEIKKQCEKNKIHINIYERQKNLYSIYKKLCSIGKTITDIDNRICVRIVVPNVDDCYRVIGIVHGKYLPKTDRFRDYIANPKANSYKSLHTSVFGHGGLLTEVQIRTEQMHIDSEFGIAASFFSDEKKIGVDSKKFNWLQKVLDINKAEKDSDAFMESLKLDIFQDRIFVFTPKGEPIDLPKGASVLDFAYAIHSDLGNHSDKANINGKTYPISTTLKNGDVVNIISSSKSSPDLSWLSFVKTSAARNKILAYLKKVSTDKKMREGSKILQREFDIAGLGLYEHMNFRRINKCLNTELDRNFLDMSDILKAIGSGELKATDVIRSLQENYKHLSRFSTKADKNCGNGIKVSIKIVAKNRFGLLRDIAEILYEHALDMYALKGWASKYEADAYFTADLLVEDHETASRIFNKLEQMEDVLYVYRTSRPALLFIATGSTITTLLWIFNPFIIRLFTNSNFSTNHKYLTNFLVYGGLFCLMAAIVYLADILKEYFPVVRSKKLIWMVSLLIPVFASATLAIELIYFELHLSLTVIFLEILLIYIYLIVNLMSGKKTIGRT